MAARIRRRDFVRALGNAAAGPLGARAQQPAIPVVGFLRTTLTDVPHYVTAFRQSLKEDERLSALSADLVRRHVAANRSSFVPFLKGAK